MESYRRRYFVKNSLTICGSIVCFSKPDNSCKNLSRYLVFVIVVYIEKVVTCELAVNCQSQQALFPVDIYVRHYCKRLLQKLIVSIYYPDFPGVLFSIKETAVRAKRHT